MKPSEVLNLSAEVVMSGWARDGYALASAGNRIHVMSQNAVAFCAVGAVARVLGGSTRAADEILDQWVVPLLPIPLGTQQRTVRRWNDDLAKSKEEVAGLLKTAADVAKSKGE